MPETSLLMQEGYPHSLRVWRQGHPDNEEITQRNVHHKERQGNPGDIQRSSPISGPDYREYQGEVALQHKYPLCDNLK